MSDVGGRDEIRRALAADLQLLDLAEVADQRAASLLGGAHHHIDIGGSIGHRGSGSGVRGQGGQD
jgi:hypothetical protein